MIRFIHTADWHLGARGIPFVDDLGVPLQFRWVEDAARQMVDFIAGRGADVAFLCGDILNSRNPTPTVENILAGILRNIVSAGAQVVYLLGNHEYTTSGVHPAKIYSTLGVEGITVIDRVGVYPIEVKGKVLYVAALPSVPGDVSAMLREVSVRVEGKAPAVLVAHGYVVGAKLSGSDFPVSPDEATIKLSELTELPVAYAAMGHIHRHQRLWSNPPVVYSGSLQRVNFAERDEPKGFVYGEIYEENDVWRARWEFVPVKAVDFVQLEVDLSDVDSPMELLEDKLREVPVGSVVKLVLYRRRRETTVSLRKIRNVGRQMGLYVSRLEFRNVEGESIVGRGLISPTGNPVEDVRRYVMDVRPDLKDKLPEILSALRQFLD